MCILAAGTTVSSAVTVTGMKVYALTKALKDVAATLISAGTEVTKVTWGMLLTADCSGTAGTAPCQVAATTDIGHASSTAVWGWSNYQPKETSDKVYVGIPRFSKGETLAYKGVVTASGVPTTTCGAGAVLTGASALVAGAAVAFGAAALAF